MGRWEERREQILGGGYMMCCVADKIVSSPFAVLGSIGVITDIPNVYDRLKKEGIEFQTVTAGKYKRTITPTKKVTKEDFDKTQEDVEGILTLFKQFVHQNRPSLAIDEVATGTCPLLQTLLEMFLVFEACLRVYSSTVLSFFLCALANNLATYNLQERLGLVQMHWIAD